MKKIIFVPFFLCLLTGVSSAQAQESSSANNQKEICKENATYKYHFDMMKIEGEEIRGKISHEEAGSQKNSRHKRFRDELEDCQ